MPKKIWYGAGASFDLANVNQNMEILGGVLIPGAGTDPRQRTRMDELYTDEKNSKIMAYGRMTSYGWQPSSDAKTYYVRVLGEPINTATGRIRYSMKYYNSTPETLDIVPSFGVHMDIQGKHKESKMYSQGNKKGIYFKEDGAGNSVLDGLPYYVYFYRDGYGSGANPPSFFKGNDDAEFTLKGNFPEHTNLNRPEESDPGKDKVYKYDKHPGWIYRWDKAKIPPNGIGEVDMDISVGTVKPDQVPITVKYLNEDGDIISATKSYSKPEGGFYTESPKKISGFEYERVEGSKESGIVKEGDVIEINYYYTSQQFELVQEVTHLDGTTADADNVKPGEELIYTVNLTSNIKSEILTPSYNGFEIKNILDENLENVTDVTLVNSKGKNVGTAKFDTKTKTVVGSLKLLDGVKASEDLVLSYHATVKNDAPGGSKIKEQATAGGKYSGIPEIPAREQTSNEVESTVVDGASLLVKYVNEDGVEIHERKAEQLDEGETYDEKEIAIDGFVFDHAEGTTSGTAQAGESIIIIFHYKSDQFEIVQTVSRLDGSSADIVKNEEELIYTVAINSKLKEGTILYNDFTILEPIDSSLEDIKEVSLVDSTGKVVGTATYDTTTNTVTAKLTAADAVPSTESLLLSYHAKVKADSPEGTVIKEQATAGGSYVGTPEIPAKEQVSNEVESRIVNSATVLVKYVNEDGIEIAPSKSYELDEDGNYDEKEIEIDGFIFDHAEGETSGTAQPGENVIIIFHYKSNQFEITQEVSRLDGSSANAVKNEEELIYTVKVTSKLQTETSLYNEFVINEPIDSSLENIKDVTLVDGAGQPVGKATFDSAKQAVVATLIATDKVKGTENLVLSYHATVKNETAAPQGTEIKEQATAGGSYVGTPEIPAREQTSNEVISVIIGGELIFESAPDTLDFGQDLKISLREETYPVVTKDNPLTVIDTRGKGEVWSMTAKMTKLMVNGEHTLAESMHYIMNGKSQLMTLETSANVYDKVTDSDDAVVISDEWLETTEGPVLKVGKNEAQLGNYQGIIQWTLQDVPLSE
ncbi:MucBP domain-containing protein [Vagococcus salmoninarum]|uniref:MucBP domain-containing protein n=1 Tax=Vagococcus salmoninarum TaxID=2739 RepID=UPI003F99BA05